MNTYNELGIKVTKTLDDLSMIVTSNLLSRINTMKVSGMAASEVRKVLVADLIAGGRIFGQLKNGVKNISKNAVEEAGNIAAQKAFEQQGLKQYRWISVGKNVCPDCKPRHGVTGDLEYFKAIGMPKSEFSVCGLNCNCQLVPIEYDGEDLSKPIKYKKSITAKDVSVGFDTKKQATDWLLANGVSKVLIKTKNIQYMNEIADAVSSIPKKYRKDIIIADFQSFQKIKGRKFSKVQNHNYGVSQTIDQIDSGILTIEERRDIISRGITGQYHVVAYNTRVYKTVEDITKRKRLIQSKYLDQKGRNYFFNETGELTISHEIGHIIHNQLPMQVRNKWDNVARQWANNTNADLLKVKQGEFMGEHYAEAFSEAWACYTKGDRKRLPKKVIDFIKKEVLID